jgi:hypothetical protein
VQNSNIENKLVLMTGLDGTFTRETDGFEKVRRLEMLKLSA